MALKAIAKPIYIVELLNLIIPSDTINVAYFKLH